MTSMISFSTYACYSVNKAQLHDNKKENPVMKLYEKHIDGLGCFQINFTFSFIISSHGEDRERTLLYNTLSPSEGEPANNT